MRMIILGLLLAVIAGANQIAEAVSRGDTVPFMLVVEHAGGARCAGALVSLRSAMTSASCARLGSGLIHVLSGQYLTGQASRAEGARLVSSIALPIGHSRNGDYYGAVDDVAVLRLASPFVSSAHVRPILMETEHTSYEAPGNLCNLVRAVPANQRHRRDEDQEPVAVSQDPLSKFPASRSVAFTSSDEFLSPDKHEKNNSDRHVAARHAIFNSSPQVIYYESTNGLSEFDYLSKKYQENITTLNDIIANDIDNISVDVTFDKPYDQRSVTVTVSEMNSTIKMSSTSNLSTISDDKITSVDVFTDTPKNGYPLFTINVTEVDLALNGSSTSYISTYPDSINNIIIYDTTEQFETTNLLVVQGDTANETVTFMPTIDNSLIDLLNSTADTLEMENSTTEIFSLDATFFESIQEDTEVHNRSIRAQRSEIIFLIFDVRVTSSDQCHADNSFAGNHYWVSMRDQVFCTRGEPFCQTDWGTGLVCGGKLCGVLSRTAYITNRSREGRADPGCGNSHTLQSLARWRRFLHCAHTVGACQRDPCMKLCREVFLTGDTQGAPAKELEYERSNYITPQHKRTSTPKIHPYVLHNLSPSSLSSGKARQKTKPLEKQSDPLVLYSDKDSDDDDERTGMNIEVPNEYLEQHKPKNEDPLKTGRPILHRPILVNEILHKSDEKPHEKVYIAVQKSTKPHNLVPTRSTLPTAIHEKKTPRTSKRVGNVEFDPLRPDYKPGDYEDNAADYQNTYDEIQTNRKAMSGARRPPTRSTELTTTVSVRTPPEIQQHIVALSPVAQEEMFQDDMINPVQQLKRSRSETVSLIPSFFLCLTCIIVCVCFD